MTVRRLWQSGLHSGEFNGCNYSLVHLEFFVILNAIPLQALLKDRFVI